MRRILLLIIFIILLTNLKANRVKIIETIRFDNKNFYNKYFYDGNKIISLVTFNNDSFFYFYIDNQVRVTKYKLVSKKYKKLGIKIFYYNQYGRVKQKTFGNFVESMNDSCYAELPFTNNYHFLNNDFCYLKAILDADEIVLPKSNNLIDTFTFDLDIGVGQIQHSVLSPFFGGNTIKKLKLIIDNNHLIEIYGEFTDERQSEKIKHQKIYHYDSYGNLIYSKSINLTLDGVQSEKIYKYSYW